ncbi:MAG: oligosaccharide flippase family protein [Bacteroidaceae bacterium]|nr:oligosaccharide flippase family protein [Bacteroidaceae bacterium]
MSTQYKNILKYVGFFGSIQGLNLLVGLVRSKIVAILLGPGGMGLLSLFNTAIQLLNSGTNLGIGISGVKELSELEDHKEKERKVAIIRTWSLIAAAIGFVATVMAAPLIDKFSFSWGQHTLHYIALAPVVSLMAIIGGEAAILKAERKLRNLAIIQVITMTVSVIISLPVYYFFGQSGIVPVIFLTMLTTTIATLRYSYRCYPLRLSGIRKHIQEGKPMVRLGLSFVLAGIVGSGVEMYIRSFLNMQGDLEMVGLYFAGFSIAITYPSALLNSLENDYFARLSSVNNDTAAVSRTVNAQVEVLLMVMFPVLALLMIAMPVVMPLLFSSKFCDVIPMTQVTLVAMFIRSASLPVEYISLARGGAKTFLLIEIISGIITMISLTVGFLNFGLWGMGAGWVVSYSLLIVFVLIFFRYRWKYLVSARALAMLVAGIVLLATLYVFIVK